MRHTCESRTLWTEARNWKFKIPLGYVTTKAVRAKVKDTRKKTALHSCILSEAPTVPHGTGPPAACLWALTVIEGAITPLGTGHGGWELGSQCQLEPSGTSVAQWPSGNMYVIIASHPRNRLLLNIMNTFSISLRCLAFLISEPIRKYFCRRKMYVNCQDNQMVSLECQHSEDNLYLEWIP